MREIKKFAVYRNSFPNTIKKVERGTAVLEERKKEGREGGKKRKKEGRKGK